jgi:hypothetical protein
MSFHSEPRQKENPPRKGSEQHYPTCAHLGAASQDEEFGRGGCIAIKTLITTILVACAAVPCAVRSCIGTRNGRWRRQQRAGALLHQSRGFMSYRPGFVWGCESAYC